MGASIAASIIGKRGRGRKGTREALGRIEEKIDKLSSQAEEVGAAATAVDPESGVSGDGTTPGTFDEGTQEAAETMYGTEQERLAASQSAAATQNVAAVGGTANISGL